MRTAKICIVGAGIGGLTAALSLQRRGLAVTVHERAAQLGEVGAGILATPNSMRALEDLGVAAQVRESASCEEFAYYASFDKGEVLLQTDISAVKEKYGYPVLQVLSRVLVRNR